MHVQYLKTIVKLIELLNCQKTTSKAYLVIFWVGLSLCFTAMIFL